MKAEIEPNARRSFAIVERWRLQAQELLEAAITHFHPSKPIGFTAGALILLIAIGGATALRLALLPAVSGVPYIFYFPAIVMVGALAGARWGLASIALSMLIAWYMFVSPAFSFEIDNANDVLSLAAFAFAGALVLAFPLLLRQAMERLHASESKYRRLSDEMSVAQERLEVINGELQHRLKNLMAIISAIVKQSRPRGNPDIDAYADAFLGRLFAILRTGEIVLASTSRQADFHHVARQVLSPFVAKENTGQIDIEGCALGLSEVTAGSIALALHELATNSLKYGALSSRHGRAMLRWRIDGRRAVIAWEEKGGPPAKPPERIGFGSRLIQMAVSREQNPDVQLSFEPAGLRCTIAFDLADAAPLKRYEAA